jgi:LPXTG-motif cell wall-anchored protein
MKKKNMILPGVAGLLATAAAIFFLKKKKDEVHEKPPKSAPQLDIENPGDQSEFISSPTESEIG